jgi:hypothetical protein
MKTSHLIGALVCFSWASAFATLNNFQGFESDTGDWIASQSIARVPSNGGVLALPSRTGNSHAEIRNLHDGYAVGFGDAGYSLFGGQDTVYRGDFYQAIDVYINVNWAPAEDPDAPSFWIDMTPWHGDPNNYCAEHNFQFYATGSQVDVAVDGQAVPVAVLKTSGWYTFMITYRKPSDTAAPVISDMKIYDPSNTLVSKTRVYGNTPVPPYTAFTGAEMGGNGYVWITLWQNSFANDVLAIDNVRTGLLPSEAAVTIVNKQFTVDDQRIWFNGANTPWHAWNDFGGNYDHQWWSNHFQTLHDNGINATRVWITCSGEVGINIDTNGWVSGATQAHWTHLDDLLSIAQEKRVYIMATLISFDHFNDAYPTYARWRKMLSTDANINSFVNNYVGPFATRYKNNPWLWSIDLINEPDWVYEDAACGNISWDRLQTYFAKSAKAIHANSPILVTVGAAMPKYQSTNPGNEGDKMSDTALKAKDNDAKVYLDFRQTHYYSWMDPYWAIPFYATPASMGFDGNKPWVIGECPALGSTGHTLTQDYETAYVNGWQGAMAWTSNGVDQYGNLAQLSPATQAFRNNHLSLVFPPTTLPVVPTGVRPGTSTTSSVQLLWTDTPGETKYQIIYTTSADSAFTIVDVPANSTSYTIPNLPANVTVYAYINSWVGSTSSAWSNYIALAVTPSPILPTNVRAGTSTSTSVQVLWNDTANETKYQVSYKQSTQSTYTTVDVPANSTAYTISNLPAGAIVYVRVKSWVNSSSSAWAGPVTLRTK